MSNDQTTDDFGFKLENFIRIIQVEGKADQYAELTVPEVLATLSRNEKFKKKLDTVNIDETGLSTLKAGMQKLVDLTYYGLSEGTDNSAPLQYISDMPLDTLKKIMDKAIYTNSQILQGGEKNNALLMHPACRFADEGKLQQINSSLKYPLTVALVALNRKNTPENYPNHSIDQLSSFCESLLGWRGEDGVAGTPIFRCLEEVAEGMHEAISAKNAKKFGLSGLSAKFDEGSMPMSIPMPSNVESINAKRTKTPKDDQPSGMS